MNIAIFGAGAWGTAMAIHLARKGHTITLVSRRVDHAAEVASTRENTDYLPGYKLDKSIQLGCEVGPVMMEAELLLLACPSKGIRSLCENLAEHREAARQVKCALVMCKGLEVDTWKRPSEIVSELLPGIATGCLSGPTHAADVAAGLPTAITLGADSDEVTLCEMQHAVNSELLRVYRTQDVAGVELGGCLKNIYAIGAGICDGLKLGDNAKAAYLTRALSEMARLGQSRGGQSETFFGLSGFGDLVATCSGSWSRNRTFGEQLAQGNRADELMQNRKTVVEGYAATQTFAKLCQESGTEAPILMEIKAVLDEKITPRDALMNLMTRELKDESDA